MLYLAAAGLLLSQILLVPILSREGVILIARVQLTTSPVFNMRCSLC